MQPGESAAELHHDGDDDPRHHDAGGGHDGDRDGGALTMARRIRWLGVGMVVCFFLLFLQLNDIQVVKAHQYATDPDNPAVKAQGQQPRGDIQSADGQILAKSVRAPKNSGYKYERVYPEKWASLFSGVVGVDSPNYENYGVEASYNSYLVAHNRPITSLKDLLTTGAPITDTVTLTLSTTLQAAARSALGQQVGAVVALDPQTGAVLAMYSNPTYDPNLLASLNSDKEAFAFTEDNTRNAAGFTPFTSLAYQDASQFGPGSTFKIVTTAAAYDKAPQLVNTPIPVFTTIPANYFKGQSQSLSNDDFASCGGTIATMLPISCDTGYAILGTKIGAPAMTAEADGFGFNQQPPIDLPHGSEEVSNFLQPACYENAQVFLAYSSIGQKCTQASPLQMAMVASAIADNGVIMTPHVMDQIRDSDGNLVDQYQPIPWKQATSPQTAQAINLLMREVVTQGTADYVGFLPQDDVAAKTGTAQAGVGNTNVNGWMIAFAPANHPTVAIAVVIPNTALYKVGAQVAGPVMKAMIEAALGPQG
ncbi:MAG TPA: penicillin-binding transpeptidase domain-containing protein [Acidimicrobiales bacterium]|nr:penicillin-binding transpeptidase domain-containing protein [Acidimicrobiales bacterium]